MRKKGLILAAGKSSRMGALKPLMKINGYPLIEWAMMNMRNGGITDICVVLGKEAGRITPYLVPYQVAIVENKDYETTDMLTSIRLGLQSLLSEDTESICILPCDNSMIHPGTIRQLHQSFLEHSEKTVIPTYFDCEGHPPLISREMAEVILSQQASHGLREIFSKFENNIWKQECGDPGIGMDADSPNDFLKLSEYGKKNFGISEDQVVFYWETNQVSRDLRTKAFKLRNAAVERGMKLNEHAAALDLTLIDSGSLFCVLFPQKDKIIDLLIEEGYERLAQTLKYEPDGSDEQEWTEGRVIAEVAREVFIED